ncbi:MAG: hypothetical protein A2848_01725 [Candidatus Magasanikbacteria bacterium RIFCSPHIGHO2_01_FULL_50_8]|uniref:Uncharacterized protein n=2 Tax=Candidatus Magasanikiibacteriota TaxID=1752731 RepID=A0A1F6LVQ3_9BACT|nr:MAG: hypothetical protein A2848_01725 [Candidatus Magasanikbacteria bacterium RIFCSPHIGHO2_01_FULL_50_8]OGH68230.1 MAG: hypothetical protein A3C15_01245 [Candidatus Magasanikbacteria bacterium RIFCSPHIGHO2_02_FULL_50_9b]
MDHELLYTPPNDLALRIMRQVAVQNYRHATRLFWSRISIGACAVATVPNVVTFWAEENAQTGFMEIMVTIASNISASVVAWREVLWSLIESVPVMSISMVLFVTLVAATTIISSIRSLKMLTVPHYAS